VLIEALHGSKKGLNNSGYLSLRQAFIDGD
jgi:hypothetical protein